MKLDFLAARKAIQEGRAKAHSLWILMADEHERDGYGLKPEVWEGPGEYQRVTRTGDDSLGVLVRLPGLVYMTYPSVQSGRGPEQGLGEG